MTGKLGKSNIATKCTAGTHEIAVGADNYYEKINDRWIRCIDLECFKKQGGTFDASKTGQQFKGRAKETRFQDAVGMLDLLWPVAVKKAADALPYPKLDGVSSSPPDLGKIDFDRKILAQVFLKVMAEEYTR